MRNAGAAGATCRTWPRTASFARAARRWSMADEAEAAPAEPIDYRAFRGPLPAELRLKRTRSVALVIAFLVFALDQATKWVVAYPLQLEFRRTIEIADFFN